ncbi:MAG: histidinol dehydrogenase, partial [Saprospiraceae bacterium]
MKTIKYPDKTEWPKLITRPEIHIEDLENTVNKIFTEIRENGDKAVKKYTSKFDNVELKTIQVTGNELSLAKKSISDELISAIELAIRNIGKFHIAQIEKTKIIETTKGVLCWRESRPIEKIGFYIPGGTAPLFSTVLMLGIPAKLAGCKEIILCTPPDKKGNINPVILWTAMIVGVTSIFKVGGIQAIGAMTFGTQSIPKVDKIFGPGNQYVTAAKQIAQKYQVATDMPAGPSEVLVIADSSSNLEFVAADLLSQAEHGPDSQVILLSDDLHIIVKTVDELNKQLKKIPRKA